MTTNAAHLDGSDGDDRRTERTAELRSLFERISPVTTFTEPRQADRRRGAVLTDAEVDEAAAALGIDPATAARAARTLRARRRTHADGYRARLDVEAALSDAGVDLDAVVRETLRHDRETLDEVRE
jgi:hypothetical protein